MSELKHTCCERVQKNYLFHLCGKTAKFERDNKWYCGMHDPIAVAAKYAKRKEAHEENLRAFYKAQEEKKETQRRADLYPELLEALKQCFDYPSDVFETAVEASFSMTVSGRHLQMVKAVIDKAEGKA